MTVTVTWWELADSGKTIEALEADLRTGSVEPWCEVEGLHLKLWIVDRENNRWGAVMWWDRDPPAAALPANRAAELIGRPPDLRTQFEVAAIAEGMRP